MRGALACAGAIGLISGCGGGTGASSVSYGHGSSATFVIDGRSISVNESGTASVHVDGAPELTHSGAVGCAGRYFTASFVDGVPMYFRYGSRDAYLLIGSDLYYLGGAPGRADGALSWSTYTNGHQIDIRVACPPPPDTGPLTASAVPAACAVLTPAIARAVLHEPVGAPKFVQENPDLSYCEYRSARRSVSLSVATADELAQLSSWDQPPIAGLGDAAHGGQASDGLAVRSGKRGYEITVDLGFDANNARDLAAEEALARTLLSRPA